MVMKLSLPSAYAALAAAHWRGVTIAAHRSGELANELVCLMADRVLVLKGKVLVRNEHNTSHYLVDRCGVEK